ncbi:MAG: glutathione S-transferase N-terminal domain-containing protein [Gammaproteobacteria bacterium]|nr:glutathione S-transferase N-terminal domain-containing protein [Gammaproteobacteria bacterium]
MTYRIYGDELSLFTRKLECACLFYGLDFERCDKTRENAAHIEQRAGTHQVPVLHTPENWMLSDTTPILALLDARHPGREMFPPGLYGAIAHILNN